ncbi:hypothetical protein [Rhizobium leguminosarum]|uniref:hypothetical protein n=1 Tax=Rhizobium leguminosarum TaxID=384 RepID=UPI001C96F4B8|nr:hypothetical protein [Rhizobium leguminosarum]MBY5346044.1 hypothetical protein [Rhizobium leguminosarum]
MRAISKDSSTPLCLTDSTLGCGMCRREQGAAMPTSSIRAVENSQAFSVYLDALDGPCILPHDDDFPPFEGGGYEEEIEFNEPEEWDEVEFVFDGCPDGYVIVVFKFRKRPVLCLLYGPAGFVASFGSIPEARNAARAQAGNKPSSGSSGPAI